MSAVADVATWTWDSKVATVTVVAGEPLAPFHGHRVLTTNDGRACLWGPNMTADYHRVLEGVERTGGPDEWLLVGTNPATGLQEEWRVSPLARPGTGCGSCGGRR